MDERSIKERDDEQRISGEDARGGEIILRTRAQRIIFILGLVGVAVLAVAVILV